MSVLDKMRLYYRIVSDLKLGINSMGLVGNLLMLVIFSRGANLRRLSVSFYIRCMSISCICVNIYYIIQVTYLQPMERKHSTRQLVLKLLAYVERLIISVSVWLEVAATLDRFLTIVSPRRKQLLHNAGMQRSIVAGIVLFNMTYYSYILIEISQNHDYSPRILNIMDMVNQSAVPFAIMFVASVATFLGVLKSHRRINSIKRTRNSTLARDIKFGITIIVLNVIFFIFNVLYVLHKCVEMNPFDVNKKQISARFLFVSIFYLYEYYYSIYFYVQLTVNNQVRREFFKIFLSPVFGFLTRKIRKFSKT